MSRTNQLPVVHDLQAEIWFSFADHDRAERLLKQCAAEFNELEDYAYEAFGENTIADVSRENGIITLDVTTMHIFNESFLNNLLFIARGFASILGCNYAHYHVESINDDRSRGSVYIDFSGTELVDYNKPTTANYPFVDTTSATTKVGNSTK